MPRTLVVLATLLALPYVHVSLGAQATSAGPSPAPARIGVEVSGGPAFEVATAGDRASQRGMLVVPAVGIRVASWFDYTFEGHFSRHVTPVAGNIFGIVPIGFRVHSRGSTQIHVSAGAGIAWSGLTGLRGVEQRRNFLTQIGVGVARLASNGSGLSVEARLFHLSNLSAAPPNLGMEVVSILVGYRLPR